MTMDGKKMTRMEKQMAFRTEMNRRARTGMVVKGIVEFAALSIGALIIMAMLVGIMTGNQNWGELIRWFANGNI